MCVDACICLRSSNRSSMLFACVLGWPSVCVCLLLCVIVCLLACSFVGALVCALDCSVARLFVCLPG